MKLKALIISIFNFPNDFITSAMCGFRYARGQFNIDPTEYKTQTGIPVVCCDDALCIIGRIPPRAPGAALIIDTTGIWRVLVNKKMLKQPAYIINAALAHEDGHYNLHRDQLVDLLNHNLDKNVVFDSKVAEYEADDYAIECGADMIKVLKCFESFGYDMHDRIVRLENN